MGLGRRKAEIQRSDRAREDQHRCGALNCKGLLVNVALWKAWPLCGVNALAVVHPMRAIEKGPCSCRLKDRHLIGRGHPVGATEGSSRRQSLRSCTVHCYERRGFYQPERRYQLRQQEHIPGYHVSISCFFRVYYYPGRGEGVTHRRRGSARDFYGDATNGSVSGKYEPSRVIFGPGRAENSPTGSAVSGSGAVSATDFFFFFRCATFACRSRPVTDQSAMQTRGRQDATSGASSRAGDHVFFLQRCSRAAVVFCT